MYYIIKRWHNKKGHNKNEWHVVQVNILCSWQFLINAQYTNLFHYKWRCKSSLCCILLSLLYTILTNYSAYYHVHYITLYTNITLLTIQYNRGTWHLSCLCLLCGLYITFWTAYCYVHLFYILLCINNYISTTYNYVDYTIGRVCIH